MSIAGTVRIVTSTIGGLGFLSVAPHIGLFFVLSFLALFLLALYTEQYRKIGIPRWLLNVLSLLVVALSVLRLSGEDFVTVTLEALVILLGIKLLEEKKFRDHMQIYLITILLLAGSSLISLDVVFLGYFLVLFFLLSLATVLLTYHGQDGTLLLEKAVLLKILAKTLLIPTVALPLTALMFIVLPRTNFPLLSFLNRGEEAKTGFTDQVRLGAVSAIQEDGSVIFRVSMERADEDSLYWRGMVLDSFDGTGWEASGKKDTGRGRMDAMRGKRVEQIVYLEPYGNKYLFAADKPVSLSMRNLTTSRDLTSSLPANIGRRIRYEAVSVVSEVIPEREVDSGRYLQLPENLPKEIPSLAADITAGKEGRQAIEALMSFFGKGSFGYSLKELPITETPLVDFLFRYRYGNCEYFASALAVMLRSAGIPARLVGGYRGGYYSDIGKYYIVPQKNAHVWVEAHVKGEGWIRVDPTPAAADRFTLVSGTGFLFRLRLLLDSVNYYWNAAVINYDFKKQLSLFKKVRGLKPSRVKPSVDSTLLVGVGTLLIVSAFGFFVVRALLSRKKPAEVRVIGDFHRKMKKRGYTRKGSEGLEEFAVRVSDQGLREDVLRFVREFEISYYKDRVLSRAEADRLRRMVKGL